MELTDEQWSILSRILLSRPEPVWVAIPEANAEWLIEWLEDIGIEVAADGTASADDLAYLVIGYFPKLFPRLVSKPSC